MTGVIAADAFISFYIIGTLNEVRWHREEHQFTIEKHQFCSVHLVDLKNKEKTNWLAVQRKVQPIFFTQ